MNCSNTNLSLQEGVCYYNISVTFHGDMQQYGEGARKEGSQSANCHDLPSTSSSSLGFHRSVGRCIWNFDLRVFVSRPPQRVAAIRIG